MSPTFCLITAALLTGQVPQTRLAPVPSDPEPAGIVAPNPGCGCNRGAPEGVWHQGRSQEESEGTAGAAAAAPEPEPVEEAATDGGVADEEESPVDE